MTSRHRPARAALAVLACALGVLPTNTIAQSSADPRPLPIEDYDRWRGIESVTLAPDGNG